MVSQARRKLYFCLPITMLVVPPMRKPEKATPISITCRERHYVPKQLNCVRLMTTAMMSATSLIGRCRKTVNERNTIFHLDSRISCLPRVLLKAHLALASRLEARCILLICLSAFSTMKWSVSLLQRQTSLPTRRTGLCM